MGQMVAVEKEENVSANGNPSIGLAGCQILIGLKERVNSCPDGWLPGVRK
jgi:hypothetical protein